ncbi:hypothetical protein WR25_12093 [Diploscapter pachys]|uniref:Mothers against decapentaplegic homolog n=1 Tax=Diploscapter pachys TaxID=2018661 RepID=A0A2A2JGM1_9BILA|nr:hypothetical protein WR25_12093 [Diploscapter pachys]
MSDLRSIKLCEHPFSLKATSICINPTHYEGNHPSKPDLKPMVVFKDKDYGSKSRGPFYKANWMPYDPTNEQSSSSQPAFFNCELRLIDEMRGIDPNDMFSDTSCMVSREPQFDGISPNDASNLALSTASSLYFDASGRSYLDSPVDSPVNSVGDCFEPEPEVRSLREAPDVNADLRWNEFGELNGSGSLVNRPIIKAYIERSAMVATQEGEHMEIIDDSPSDEGLKPTLDEETLRQRKALLSKYKNMRGSFDSDSDMDGEELVQDEEEPMETDDYHETIKNMPPDNYELIEYQDMKEWLSFAYYEGVETIGTHVYASSPYYLIDGCFKLSQRQQENNSSRFSVGSVESIQRNKLISDTKKLIGRGVRFYNVGGEVFVECLSEYPIFLQSATYNYRRKFDPNAIIKMPPGCNIKIFNVAEFSRLLELCVSRGYNTVHSLMRMCTFRVSFVRGWGMNYKRAKISSTHCWFEAHYMPAIYWVERILRSMEGHDKYANSST